jgi:hypothetical protein
VSVHPAFRIEVRDEGTTQGRARAVNFVGGLIAAAVSGDVATVTLSLTANDTSTIDLTLSGSTLTADIVSASITNAYINATAAIAMSKLAALTTSRAVQTNSSTGFLEVSSVTNTELGYVSGVTSAIQTQINAISSSPLAALAPSAAATADFTSTITSTYDFYDIYFHLVPATDAQDLGFRTDSNNGASFDAGASDYKYTTWQMTSAAGSLAASTGANNIKLSTASPGNASGRGVTGYIALYRGSASNPARIAFVTIGLDSSGNPIAQVGGGQRTSNAAIDAARLFFASGNLTGVAYIYGRKVS